MPLVQSVCISDSFWDLLQTGLKLYREDDFDGSQNIERARLRESYKPKQGGRYIGQHIAMRNNGSHIPQIERVASSRATFQLDPHRLRSDLKIRQFSGVY